MAGSDSSASTSHHITVLCVACSPKALAQLKQLLQHSRIHILSASTRDQAVAACVSHNVHLAVLDGESIRGQELSLAEALKIIRPSLPVILLEERQRPETDLPQYVDAIMRVTAPEELLRHIEELLNRVGAL